MEGKQNEQSSTETKSAIGDDEILKNGIPNENLKNKKSNADDSDMKNSDSGLPATEDELYLKDVFLGFDDEDNLKEPLKGFTDSQTDAMIPFIDNQSLILFEIVEEIECEQMTADVTSILSYNKPIIVPKSKYLLPGGGGIHMRIFNKEMSQEAIQIQNDSTLTSNDGLGNGRICHSPAKETAFNDNSYPTKLNPSQKSDTDKLQINRAKKTGGSKKSTFVRRPAQLPKRYSTGENVVYPEKIAKTKKPQRNDTEMQMGMLPPKYPKGREDMSNSSTPLSLSPDQLKARRRGRPPKPGGKMDLAQTSAAAALAAGIFNESDSNNSMFQISAFRECQLMEAAIEQYQEMQDMETDADPEICGSRAMGGTEEENSQDESNENCAQILPCSVRCEGMTGQVPTLQCTRCLCLYHPECWNLTLNLNYKDFLCSNCEGDSCKERVPVTAAVESPIGKPEGSVVKKRSLRSASCSRSSELGEIVKQEPQLAPFVRGPFYERLHHAREMLRGVFPCPPPMSFKGRGMGMGVPAVSRLGKPPPLSMIRPTSQSESMSITHVPMKRARGRPPKNKELLSHLSQSLTITPITIPKKVPLPPLKPAGIFPTILGTNFPKPDLLTLKTNKGAVKRAIASTKSTSSSSPSKLKSLQKKKIETLPEKSMPSLQQSNELKGHFSHQDTAVNIVEG